MCAMFTYDGLISFRPDSGCIIISYSGQVRISWRGSDDAMMFNRDPEGLRDASYPVPAFIYAFARFL